MSQKGNSVKRLKKRKKKKGKKKKGKKKGGNRISKSLIIKIDSNNGNNGKPFTRNEII